MISVTITIAAGGSGIIAITEIETKEETAEKKDKRQQQQKNHQKRPQSNVLWMQCAPPPTQTHALRGSHG